MKNYLKQFLLDCSGSTATIELEKLVEDNSSLRNPELYLTIELERL
jgi:hypothetical protein